MKGLYWIGEGLRFSAATIGSALFYSFLTGIMNDGSVHEEIIVSGMSYLAMFGISIATICNVSVHQVMLPLSVSFGCTREEAWKGLQVYRLTALLPIVIITFIGTKMMASMFETAPYIIIALEVAAYLFCISIGGLAGALSTKLSKTMWSIFSVITILVGIGIAGGVVLFVLRVTERPDVFVWIVLGVTVFLYMLWSIAEARVVRRLCVR
ncbi:MAG: hypothetical protein PUB98_06225 [Clostridiales bacterium]|nr:hypothetical protein [Clostridiales bacterium]